MQTVRDTHMTCSLQLMKNVLLKKTHLGYFVWLNGIWKGFLIVSSIYSYQRGRLKGWPILLSWNRG